MSEGPSSNQITSGNQTACAGILQSSCDSRLSGRRRISLHLRSWWNRIQCAKSTAREFIPSQRADFRCQIALALQALLALNAVQVAYAVPANKLNHSNKTGSRTGLRIAQAQGAAETSADGEQALAGIMSKAITAYGGKAALGQVITA